MKKKKTHLLKIPSWLNGMNVLQYTIQKSPNAPIENVLPEVLSITDICRGYHGWYPWEKNLSCGELWPHDRFSWGQILHITDCHVDKFLTWQIITWTKFSTWEMWRKFVMWRKNVSNLWCFVAFYAVLLQNHNLRSFVTISVLSQFMHFCVEKNSAKKYAPWRKND